MPSETIADSLQGRFLQWHNGETPGPWQISFYPTYRCNIRCKICWKQAFEEPIDRSEEVGKERMLELVDEAADLGVKYWVLGGGGELMLRSGAVMPMVERIRERGMNGLIQTNFTRWNDAQFEKLVEMQWDTINISLDGPTPEINDAIRDQHDYAKVVGNIKRLQEIKRAHGSVFPIINITSVVTNLNYDKLKGFIDLSESLGMSPGGLALVDLIIYGENDKAFMLSDEQRAQLPQLVDEAIAYAVEKDVTCFYLAYRKGLASGQLMDAMDLFHEPEDRLSPRSMCFEPFYHMVIMPEGKTGPCCTFHDPEKAQTVWNTPLKDVWLGPYMQEVRRRLLQGKPMDYCKECMITRIAANLHQQAEFGDHLASLNLEKGLNVPELVGRTARSIKKHGLIGTIKRGQEWFEVRKRAKQRALESSPK